MLGYRQTLRYQPRFWISTPDKVPVLVTSPVTARGSIRNNDAKNTGVRLSTRRAEEGKVNVMPQRIAIVTGAARGIGAGTAKRLAADGMAVGVLDLKEDDSARTVGEIEEAGGKAIAVGADVSDADQVSAAVERVAAELGEPTVLVNNAGVTRDNLLFKMSETDWDTVMNVHLKGAFLMSRAIQKYMVAAKWGRIVSLSSVSAVGNRGQVNYSTAKAGLQGLTKTLALELGKFGITANAIAPGFVVTDMTAGTAARLGVSFEDFQAGAAKQIPVQRVGQVEDIANAISFFASEGAGFVSGQILYVAGGPVS
jgi:3-oxoacyl-[acyl-carrier protein] reductase